MIGPKTVRNIAFLSAVMFSIGTYAKEVKELKDHPRREEVNRRVRNEERRIAKGLKDGTITPDEAKKLRSELAGVKGEEKAEVKANGGYLTKTEQKQLNQQLNEDSRQIKHDEEHPRIGEVNQRVDNQEKRIDQGVKDGQLTPAEAQQLRSEEAGIKGEEKAEVKANGGYLTKTEQNQLNQQLNQDSKQIYDDRH
jgi:hypothetical protein